MSSTPASDDDVMKLLDAGHTVILRRCLLGSCFAVCVKNGTEAHRLVTDAVDRAIGWDGDEDAEDPVEREFGDAMRGVVETDDFTPSQALYRLTEKAATGRIA